MVFGVVFKLIIVYCETAQRHICRIMHCPIGCEVESRFAIVEASSGLAGVEYIAQKKSQNDLYDN